MWFDSFRFAVSTAFLGRSNHATPYWIRRFYLPLRLLNRSLACSLLTHEVASQWTYALPSNLLRFTQVCFALWPNLVIPCSDSRSLGAPSSFCGSLASALQLFRVLFSIKSSPPLVCWIQPEVIWSYRRAQVSFLRLRVWCWDRSRQAD